jgi:hypothetical protein
MYEFEELDHLFSRVEVTGFCWLWTGYISKNGYGRGGHKSKAWQLHRLFYTVLMGPIPEGLVLDHLCRIRNCVNPDHLEPVTKTENSRRGFGVGGWRERKNPFPSLQERRFCKHGHDTQEVGITTKARKDGKLSHRCNGCADRYKCWTNHGKTGRGCTPTCTVQQFPVDILMKMG